MQGGKSAAILTGFLLLAGYSVGGGLLPAAAQQESAGEKPQAEKEEKKQVPLTEGLPQREMTKEEREEREKKLREELSEHYEQWLEEDVVYIITDEEREVFEHLQTDEEREQFIEQFWLRRDPTPNTIENEYREEHYRRIAYANERFACGKPGWKTDRGRIYISWGPPDEIESHPAGGSYVRPMEEGGGTTATYPFEKWRYRYLEGVGQEVILEFVSPSMGCQYRLTIDPSEKDALLHVPGAGLSFLEGMGLASKTDRFDRTDGTRLPTRMSELGGRSNSQGVSDHFDRMQTLAKVMQPPPVKFKDLEALVETRISFNVLPFQVRTDFLRVTNSSILVPITILVDKRDTTFQLRDGLHTSTVNVFGRVTTLTGRIVQTFEDVLKMDVPPSLFQQSLETPSIYQKTLPLAPGLYKLHLVLKDLNSGNVGTLEQRLAVPYFEENRLAHSSLILADRIERVPTRQVGTGQFVIGDTKVRPAVDDRFTPDERLGIYLQVYNLTVNEDQPQPDATIEYAIRKGEETVFTYTEKTSDLERAGRQITLAKLLPLQSFEPGQYTLDIKVTDHVNQQSINPTSTFTIAEKK